MHLLAASLATLPPLPPHRLPPEALEELRRQIGLGLTGLLPAGERVGGRFEVRELVGVGNYALVYRAVDRSARHRQVALKILHPGLDEADRSRIQAEGRMLAAHRHRNVAVFLDAGTHDGQVFLAIGFVGRNLNDLLRDGAVGVDEALRLFNGIAAGVRFLHGRGVVHRDLKPSNVLLDNSTHGLHPRVTDCGLGAWLGVGELTVDTLFHMPPEQVDDPSPEVAHDVYALGVLLFQLIAGSHPIATPEALADLDQRLVRGEPLAFAYRAVLSAHRIRSLPAGTDVRNLRDLEAILRRAVHPRPGERYGTVEAFLDDLRRYHELRPLLGVHETWQRRLGKYVLRNRMRVVAITTVSVLGGMTIGGVGWRESRPGVVVPVLDVDIPGLTATVEGRSIPFSELALHRLGPGLVTVQLDAPGYRPEDRQVWVPVAGSVTMRASLEPITSIAEITAEPAGTQVTLTGPNHQSYPPMVTPFRHRLQVGRWTAVAQAPDHLLLTQELDVVAEQDAELHLSLSPLVMETREVGHQGSLARLPGVPPRLAVTALRDGEPVLETRDARTGDLLDRSRLDALATTPSVWVDVDGDHHPEVAYVDARSHLVVRSGGEIRWQQAVVGPVSGRVVSVPLPGGPALAYTSWEDLVVRSAVDGSEAWRVSHAPGPHASPLAVADGVLVVRSGAGTLYGVRLTDGEIQWEMPQTVRLAAALLLRSDQIPQLAAIDTGGGFILVEPGVGRVLREAQGERPLRGQLPVWQDGARWLRVRVLNDGVASIEDVGTGEELGLLGRFDGAERVWTASEGGGRRLVLIASDDRLWAVRWADDSAEILFERRVDELSDPVFTWLDGVLGLAWLEGDELVVARVP